MAVTNGLHAFMAKPRIQFAFIDTKSRSKPDQRGAQQHRKQAKHDEASDRPSDSMDQQPHRHEMLSAGTFARADLTIPPLRDRLAACSRPLSSRTCGD